MRDNKRLTIFSWAFYDFANAIFGMNVIALYFALWVTVTKGAQDIVYSFTLGLSMFLAAVSMPILGALSDRQDRRMPFLIFFTILSVLFLAFIGLTNTIVLGLILFAISNFGYLISGAVFYNALLPHVADKECIGRVSGYGVSLSYLGTITGLLAIRPIALRFGYQATFMPTALFFLLFALPCFLFVKDRGESKRENLRQLVKESFKNLFATLKEIRASRGLSSFFLAIFIIINVVNAVFIFMSVYLKKALFFSDSEIITLYVISTLFSVAGAFISGFSSDRIGPKKTLNAAVLVCCSALLLAIVSFNKALLWIAGPMVALAFSAIRVSGRALAVGLFAKEKMGEIFGLIGLLSNLAFLGLLIWGVAVWLFSPLGLIKYRIALFTALVVLIAGVVILQKAPCVERKN